MLFLLFQCLIFLHNPYFVVIMCMTTYISTSSIVIIFLPHTQKMFPECLWILTPPQSGAPFAVGQGECQLTYNSLQRGELPAWAVS